MLELSDQAQRKLLRLSGAESDNNEEWLSLQHLEKSSTIEVDSSYARKERPMGLCCLSKVQTIRQLMEAVRKESNASKVYFSRRLRSFSF